jgi:hypothetical protein
MGLRKLSKCEKCVLVGSGDGTEIVLDIAPTMKRITHKGLTYFRCDNARQFVGGIEQAMYLYEKWPAKHSGSGSK